MGRLRRRQKGAFAGGYHAGANHAGTWGYGGDKWGGFYHGGYYDTPNLGKLGVGNLASSNKFGFGTDFGHAHAAWASGTGGARGVGNYTKFYSPSVLTARGAAVRGGYYHYGYFNHNWWQGHPLAWHPNAWQWHHWWKWTTWPVLIGWLGWAGPPIYYNYGDTIVYQGDQVYSNNQPIATAEQYYQQAIDLATADRPAATAEEEWQPLGVFALVQAEQSDPSAVFQLAINKSGVIRGNCFNELANTNSEVHGAVDSKTQRASWTVGDNKTTVYDTGIYNLTKDESPVLIHFDKDRTENWLLVRIREEDTQTPAGNAQTPPANTSPPVAQGEAPAKVTVMVPVDAEVYFDGSPTTETGSERVFETPPLQPGTKYAYHIRAAWNAGGDTTSQTRKVEVQAGAKVTIDFTRPAP
jgi:uncharacterized protein (TIGR03000 family)